LIKASEKDNRKSIEMYERAIKKDLKHERIEELRQKEDKLNTLKL
jgi:hypothetical protein